jgi:hypothetical protein
VAVQPEFGDVSAYTLRLKSKPATDHTEVARISEKRGILLNPCFHPWNPREIVFFDFSQNGKGSADFSTEPLFSAGDDLLSHTVSRAVQSARRGLTAVFGMGTGVTPAV